jgi:hypothetical protein
VTRWHLALFFACVVLVQGLPSCVRPVRELTVSRQHAIQAIGKLRALWNRIREIEMAACHRKMVRVEICADADKRDVEIRALFREMNAALETPGYEVDWVMTLRTLDAMGRILDALPFP